MSEPYLTDKTTTEMKIRLPADTRRKIEKAAQENNRTLNGEIVSRLEASFGGSSDHPLEDRVAALEAWRATLKETE